MMISTHKSVKIHMLGNKVKNCQWFDGLILLLYVYCHMVRNTMGIGFMALWGF